MKTNSSLNIFFMLIFPIVILGVFWGYTTFFLCIFLIFLRLSLSDKHTAGFFLILFGGILTGLTRSYYPFLPLYGTLVEAMGLILLYSDYRKCFSRQKQGFIALIIVYLVFIASYLYGLHTDYANEKIFSIIKNGIIFFLAFYSLDRMRRLEIESLVQLLLLSSICMIVFACDYYHFSKGNMIDFEWYRASVENLLNDNNASVLVGYQQVGMNAAFGAALCASHIRIRLRHLVYYLALASYIIMVSGCRQALLALILVVFLRFTYFSNTRSSIKKIAVYISAVGFLILVLYLIKNSEVSTLTNTMESGDTGRMMIFLSAFNIISNHMIFGVGLGGFPVYANIELDTKWPHNFILEILCETGLVGFSIITCAVVYFIRTTNISLKHISRSGFFYFLFYITLVVRFCVSGDLSTSIELFSALFACSSLSYYKTVHKLEKQK